IHKVKDALDAVDGPALCTLEINHVEYVSKIALVTLLGIRPRRKTVGQSPTSSTPRTGDDTDPAGASEQCTAP
ncbi:hypothetical protein, partial [Streptomyces sp. NPDC003832]